MSDFTPSQTVGPFFGFALPFPGGAEVAEAGPGTRRLEGQLLDGAGEPVPDGLIEIWHRERFGRCRTDAEGLFHFTLPPAPHYNVYVFARGLLRHLVTRVYLPGGSDASLERVPPERRATLVAGEDGGTLRWDIRLQGDRETVFFEPVP
ncbi:MAG TPA: protocatechuate 3,4-dioxygenase subunit alpha [Candidatus Dormibacteraeota bacterium]